MPVIAPRILPCPEGWAARAVKNAGIGSGTVGATRAKNGMASDA
jgi:hypothetical protein